MASRLVVGMTVLATVAALATASTNRELVRDPLSWPFASTSIWNMPIGTERRLCVSRSARCAGRRQMVADAWA